MRFTAISEFNRRIKQFNEFNSVTNRRIKEFNEFNCVTNRCIEEFNGFNCVTKLYDLQPNAGSTGPCMSATELNIVPWGKTYSVSFQESLLKMVINISTGEV